MKNILVFGASNSKNSINKQLAYYTASLLKDVNLNKKFILQMQILVMPVEPPMVIYIKLLMVELLGFN